MFILLFNFILSYLILFNLILDGRKALKHNGPKVYSSTQSVQGLWRNNMFNNNPSHGILSFKEMPELPIKEDEYAPLQPYVEKTFPKTWNRKKQNSKREIPKF